MNFMKDFYNSNSILYAPGLGKNLKILEHLRNKIVAECGYIKILEMPYDEGILNFGQCEEIFSKEWDWWIGISLGASLLYGFAAHCPQAFKPDRITLINPFSNRQKLSEERAFDISNQWNFAPEENAVEINMIDVVVSIYDTSIPIYHGIKLLNLSKAKVKNLITAEADHQINDVIVQNELARALIDLGRGGNIGEYNHCNVYQRA